MAELEGGYFCSELNDVEIGLLLQRKHQKLRKKSFALEFLFKEKKTCVIYIYLESIPYPHNT